MVCAIFTQLYQLIVTMQTLFKATRPRKEERLPFEIKAEGVADILTWKIRRHSKIPVVPHANDDILQGISLENRDPRGPRL